MKIFNNNYSWKLYAIASILFLVILILFAGLYPASDYELSIFEIFPLYIWILFEIFVSFNIVFLICYAINRTDKSVLLKILLFIQILITTFLLLLPTIHGYCIFSRGDVHTHIGIINDILSYGYTSFDNFYPLSHIYIAQIAFLSNISLLKLISLTSPILNIFYILCIFLFARTIFNDFYSAIISACLGCVLFIGGYNLAFTPYGISIMIFPLILFVYFKMQISNNQFSWKLLLFIPILLMPFLHPLFSLIIIMSIISFIISNIIYIRFSESPKESLWIVNKTNNIFFLFVSIIAFIFWFSSFSVWTNNIREVAKWFGADIKSTPADSMLGTSELISTSGYNPNQILFLNFGTATILLILLFIYYFYFIKGLVYKKIPNNNLFTITFFNGFVLVITFIFLFSINISFSPFRLIYSLFPVSVLLISQLFLNQEIYQNSIAKIKVSFFIMLIILASILGLFNTFISPVTLQPNPQVTKMEMNEMRWFLENKDPKISVLYLGMDEYRFSESILGHQTTMNRGDIVKLGGNETVLPDHFNYQNKDYIYDSLNERSYLVFSKLSNLLYSEIWTKVSRFNDKDFQRLNEDKTASKIYSNLEQNIYFIR